MPRSDRLNTKDRGRAKGGSVVYRIRSTLAVTLGLALAAAAATGTAQGRHAGPGTIKIGISLSLSGGVVNAHGGIQGHKVQLKIVDDTSSPNQVVTNYQNLITKDKVAFVFGPFSTLLSAPAATVANRYHYAF